MVVIFTDRLVLVYCSCSAVHNNAAYHSIVFVVGRERNIDGLGGGQ